MALGSLSRGEDAIAAFNDAIARFGASTEPGIREQVAKALFGKGSSLATMNRGADAIAVFADLIARFSAAPEPSIQGFVSKARLERARTSGLPMA